MQSAVKGWCWLRSDLLVALTGRTSIGQEVPNLSSRLEWLGSLKINETHSISVRLLCSQLRLRRWKTWYDFVPLCQLTLNHDVGHCWMSFIRQRIQSVHAKWRTLMPYHVSTFSSSNLPKFSSEILSGHVLLLLCVFLAAIVTMIFFIRKLKLKF